MKVVLKYLLAAAALATGVWGDEARAVSLSYVGSDYDLTDLYPGGSTPYVVAPWRSDYHVKPLDADGNNVYGSAGYALFGTRFDYPNANATGGNAFVNPTDDAVYPNMINLPSFVSGSQILSSRKAGGWAYALIDDPQLTNGIRDWNWGDAQTPASSGQAPYVKLGILDGPERSRETIPRWRPLSDGTFKLAPRRRRSSVSAS